MKTWTVLVGIAAIIGVLVAIMALFYGSINNRIEDYINDPDFIKKVASEVRLPFVIFDENEVIHFDSNAMSYIDRIEVKRDEKKELESIYVYPKKFFNIAPLIECINSAFEFDEPVKVAPNGWKYSEPKDGFDYLISGGVKTIKKFKITILSKN